MKVTDVQILKISANLVDTSFKTSDKSVSFKTWFLKDFHLAIDH